MTAGDATTAMGTASDETSPYVEAARRMVPRLREMAPSIERERRLPADLVREMVDAGFFHLLVPRDRGGREADPVTAARVVEELARGDGSTGWCVMLAAQSGSFAGLLPRDEALTVWGNGGIVAGTARPIGRAVATTTPAPGYVVSGRWPFASGSSHATWFAAECMVYDGDEPRKDAQGNGVSRMVFVPRDAVTVHDTWDTLGLRATASNDFSIDGAFVPQGRGFQMLVDEPKHDWALYRALPLVFINHGTQALGVARAAIEHGVEIAAGKPGWGGVMLKETPRLQAAVAEATALVDSAREYLYGSSRRLWVSVLAGEDDAALRAKVRLATSHAATSSVRAVDLMQAAVGTSSIFTASPLERAFRDIQTASKHVMIGPMTYEAAGRVLLGMSPEFPFF